MPKMPKLFLEEIFVCEARVTSLFAVLFFNFGNILIGLIGGICLKSKTRKGLFFQMVVLEWSVCPDG